MSQKIVQQIIQELNEVEDLPKITILLAVKEFGPDRCLEMLEEAKRRYANGEMVANGSRQRTLGGCFFIQIRKDVGYRLHKQAKEILKQLIPSE